MPNNLYKRYDEICAQLEYDLCTEVKETLNITQTLKKGYCEVRSENISRNATIMKVFVDSDDSNRDLVNLLENAKYRLQLGNQDIKMGKFLQGMDLLDGQFIPFKLAGFHELRLILILQNKEDQEIPINVRIEIVNLPLDTYISNILIIPWRGPGTHDSLIISDGIGGTASLANLKQRIYNS